MTPRSTFLNVAFDQITLEQVVQTLRGVRAGDPFGYVVTPNVDHVVRAAKPAIPQDARLPEYFADARFCLCDSRVLARLARLRGVALTVVPGSDLTARLLRDVAEAGDTIAIVGGDGATVDELRAMRPDVRFTQHRPPPGMREKPAAIAAAADAVAASGARFALLAVGSPQQEMVAHALRERPGAGGLALCIGASVDFLTGRQMRAPGWMQRAGLEWAFRLAAEPRRMWRRYLVEGPRIFILTARWRQGD